MAVKAGDLELELIDGLSECVAERLPDEPVDSYAEFVRQYYHWVPAKDLTDRNPLDLCGAVVAHWRTAKRRQHGEAKVLVYNPDLERDGWHSPYTVVEVVSDDMPFIVDSVTMELSRQGYGIELIVHPVIRVVRDKDGDLIEVLEPGATAPGMVTESVIHAEVARQSDSDRLAVLRAGVELVLEEVEAAVDDWAPMRAKATALATELRLDAPPVQEHERREAEAFLEWLGEDNFTFLGYREYELGEGAVLTAVPGSGLGILRGAAANPSKQLDPKALALARSSHPLVLTKANSRATVHRPAYMDYVGVKRFARGRHGDRRTTVPRSVHDGRVQVESARDPAAARKGRARDGAGGFSAQQPRREGDDRHPRDAPARLADPDLDRGPVRDGDRDPGPRRTPARAPVRRA